MKVDPHPIREPWKVPLEDGGWCCSVCGEILQQGDFLGTYKGILPIPAIYGTHMGAT